ncbi:MAG: hypothetical protein RSB38_00220 [Oscillospiraceae bacterium]
MNSYTYNGEIVLLAVTEEEARQTVNQKINKSLQWLSRKGIEIKQQENYITSYILEDNKVYLKYEIKYLANNKMEFSEVIFESLY